MQYETIKVPIKSTSSAYYAMLRKRKKEPLKYCKCCGGILYRKYNPCNGRWEDWKHFINRNFCDNSCAQRYRRAIEKKIVEEKILKGFRPCKELEGLYCSENGDFLYKGKSKQVLKHTDRYGRKHTALLKFMFDGKTKSFSAARIVASTFIRGYSNDMYIEYMDDDIHNISVDNLRLVSKEEFYKTRCEHASEFHKTSTYQYQLDRLNVSIESNEAVLYYFQTGKFDKVNVHVEKYLYKCLCDFCIRSLYFGMEQAPIMVSDAIARWYEVLIQGHAVGHGERYCKRILTNFKHKGWYGHSGDVPKNKIELMINKLNLDCLWEKYKVTKIKH